MASQKISQQLRKLIASNNVIESAGRDFGSIGTGLIQDIKKNLSATPDDFIKQVLPSESAGTGKSLPKSGDLQPGQALNLKGESKQEQPKPEKKLRIEAGMNYFAEIRQSSERSTSKEMRQIDYQIKQIKEELERLVASSSKLVQMQYGAVSMEQAPASVGKYHLNFLEWMLLIIRNTREKVEDSGAWLSVAKRKGGLLQNAWKKGNTSVTMSNERQVATQSG